MSLEGIVLNNNPLKSKDLPAAILLFVWAALVFTALGRLDGAILNRLFMWVPDWLQANQFAVGGYSQPVRTTTFVLFLFLNGVAGPIVEELYFRGYLMPRLGRLRGWAPLINTILFSIYHFFSPWGNLSRVLAFFPMVWVVDRKKSIYIGILAHCLLNIGYCLQKAPLFF